MELFEFKDKIYYLKGTGVLVNLKHLSQKYSDCTIVIMGDGGISSSKQLNELEKNIHYLENAFTHKRQSKWYFNRIEQGQTLQQIMSILGDEAFEFDGVVEYSADKYQKELYFEDVSGQMRLYAAEVTVY